MSTQIPVGFEQKFSADFYMLSQQKGSRLAGLVRDDPTSGAKYFFFDRIGKTEMVKKTTRHMDTPIVNTPHSRRRVGVEDFVWADLIDSADITKMMKSPQNSYMASAVAAAGRKKDSVIIAAALGNSVSVDEDDAASNIALPSAQKIAVASSGLTLAKLLTTKEILDGNEVDEEGRVIVYSSKQGTNLLNTTEVKSADYNTVKALVNGQINEFLGFRFVRSERLSKASTTRSCIGFQRNALGIYVSQETRTRASERADKNYSVQVYAEQALGAVRIEDEGVVQIDCLEP